jgi:prevent-host-death family protein
MSLLWSPCIYNRHVSVTTNPPRQVGVRELKTNLSRYVAEVREGAEVVVTDHGHPVARLVPIQGQTGMERLAELISRGEVTRRQTRGPRTVPRPVRLPGGATVSDLVPDQRR